MVASAAELTSFLLPVFSRNVGCVTYAITPLSTLLEMLWLEAFSMFKLCGIKEVGSEVFNIKRMYKRKASN